MFCFSEVVVFRFSVFTCETKRCSKTQVGVAYLSIKTFCSRRREIHFIIAVTNWENVHSF